MPSFLPHLLLTCLIGIISYLVKRELDRNQDQLTELKSKQTALETRIQAMEIVNERLSGRIDTIIEILHRVEAAIVVKS